MVYLDACFLIRVLVPGTQQDRALRDWLAAGEFVAMSAVSWAECLCGLVEPTHFDLATRGPSERVALAEGDTHLAASLFGEAADSGGRCATARSPPPRSGATFLLRPRTRRSFVASRGQRAEADGLSRSLG